MKALTAAVVAAFLGAIVAANYATTYYGLVPVVPGGALVATAGTYLAGLTFVLRDGVQDAVGRWAALGLVAVGAGLSYLVADPFIALASGCAFLLAETSDALIYTPLRRRGYVRAAVASNVVGSIVDTFVFLWIAGFPVTTLVVAGQIVGKITVTAAVVGLVLALRATRREVVA